MASNTSRSEIDEEQWYFGEINRDTAIKYLTEAGGAVGTFLVRKSFSSPENFVLSYISDGGPVDILICNYWQDAFYSLLTSNENIFHGLDSLVSFYSQHPVSGQADTTTLLQPCLGEPPPAECRLHGSSNLLHRSVSQNNIVVTSELLNSGYRKIDAKNNDGKTALHVACVKGNEELVKLLLEFDANPIVRDEEGLSPLHLACRYDHSSIVNILIRDGGADVQLRSPMTGEVALHEAAACASVSCIRVLLSHNAPAWPRAQNTQTPADLAKQNQHFECYHLLINHRPKIPQVLLPEYYHGTLSRDDAQSHLFSNGITNGQFLLRRSAKDVVPSFVISLMHEAHVYHFQIQRQNSMYFVDNGPYFKCIETMIDHYSRFRDGLPTTLNIPLPPNTPLNDAEFTFIYFQERNNNAQVEEANETLVKQLRTADDVLNGNFRYASTENLLDSFDSLAIDCSTSEAAEVNRIKRQKNLTEIINTLQSKKNSQQREDKVDEILGLINMCDLQLSDTLGVGEFGTVKKAFWKSCSGDKIEVAVKTLHENNSATNVKDFLLEARVMMDLNHPYIVKLLGVCAGPPIAMVQELAAMGSLLNLLLEKSSEIKPEFHLKLWPAQVAEGMHYLERKHFVHRDLASRNLLMSSMTCVQISDFGLSRALNAPNDYYKSTKGGKWPLKWYAPESINYGQFTHSSDVWSYGVTLWEMHTFGDQPYGDLTGHQVADLIEKGERLPQPKSCSNNTYQLMLRCWNSNAKLRPTFQELSLFFKSNRDYVDIKPFMKRHD